MPKKGYSQDIENRILKVLGEVRSQGIWIRELARQTGIPASTVHYYLNNVMNNKIVIENMLFGKIKTSHYKIVKLRKFS